MTEIRQLEEQGLLDILLIRYDQSHDVLKKPLLRIHGVKHPTARTRHEELPCGIEYNGVFEYRRLGTGWWKSSVLVAAYVYDQSLWLRIGDQIYNLFEDGIVFKSGSLFDLLWRFEVRSNEVLIASTYWFFYVREWEETPVILIDELAEELDKLPKMRMSFALRLLECLRDWQS